MNDIARKLTSLLVLSALIFCSVPALAGNKAQALKHFKKGIALVEKKEFQAAAEEFEISAELYPTKNTLCNLANCYKLLYRHGPALDAISKLKRLFREDMDDQLISEIETLESDLAETMTKVEIIVDVEGATVSVDGEPAGKSPFEEPLVLLPGPHVIEPFSCIEVIGIA